MAHVDFLSKIDELQGDKDFFSKVRDWALLHGLGMRPKKLYDENTVTLAPFALFPSPIEKSSFEKAIQVQPILNSLFHRLAFDSEFLKYSLFETIVHDDFTRRLFKIYEEIMKGGFSKKFSLGLLRSDYLPDLDGGLKQVEMNTIASSMSGLIIQVERAHRYVLTELGFESHLKNLPENNALSSLCSGLIEAWKLYSTQRTQKSVILFAVEEVTYNIADQRFMEFVISQLEPQAKVIRRSFRELLAQAKLGHSKELIVGEKEVAVVYYRTGYDPAQYFSEECWELRLMIEKSLAIKCPSIQYHLVGTKKVQQVLSDPGVLERYLPDEESVKLVRGMFVEIYPMDQSSEGEKGYKLAMTEPEKFVLKPQREGGGHNVYGADIPHFLKGISREEATSYILMKLIQPKPVPNILIKPDGAAKLDTVSELGVYGVILGNDTEILVNRASGHMLRTKAASSREVGVAAGFGALDSPYLV